MKISILILFLCSLTLRAKEPSVEQSGKPNILFIALDDLNNWIGCLGGHPQALTPNLDRLAAQSVLFTNAHCVGSACNPSRTAIFTGQSPATTGLYRNGQSMRELLPEAELLPDYLRREGYYASGSGKMLHYFINASSWDTYFPDKEKEDPFPFTLYPEERPVSIPRAGKWMYVETDWAALDCTDEEFGGDYAVSNYIADRLADPDHGEGKPFFLACGFYRPHEPWFVPKKYFEPFPLESIQLPLGYKADDLEDIPERGQKYARNRYFDHIRKHDQWKQAIQGYLASIYFADCQLGRVLDALDTSPHKDNTIVVLWSDHGWHLGEKEHWQKYTAWHDNTNVPLMIRVPEGTTGLVAGTQPARCTRPVSLLSLYPTLLELAGLPEREENDGPSLVPLLENPNASWNHVAVTHLDHPGDMGISDQEYRYIRYRDGSEELYHLPTDPHEWHNLSADHTHTKALEAIRKKAPTKLAPLRETPLKS